MFRILATLSLLIVFFVLLAAFAWRLITIPFSPTTLRMLTPGMSQTQVCAILGSANQTNQLGSGETWWVYSHRPSVVHLVVIFDSTGRYKKHVTD
jgi:outer membrane protein assembly factor BamE (lipoprotein component of BamABCDE complex)